METLESYAYILIEWKCFTYDSFQETGVQMKEYKYHKIYQKHQ